MVHTTKQHLAGDYVSGEGQRCTRCGYALTPAWQAERMAFNPGTEITVRHYANGERHCIPTLFCSFPAESCTRELIKVSILQQLAREFRLEARQWATDAAAAHAAGDPRTAGRFNARSDVWELAAERLERRLSDPKATS